MAACGDCDEALQLADGGHPALLPFQGTRIAVVACDKHTQALKEVLITVDALYNSAYQEALTDLTTELLERQRR